MLSKKYSRVQYWEDKNMKKISKNINNVAVTTTDTSNTTANNNDIKNAVDNIKTTPKPRRRRRSHHRWTGSNLLLVVVLLFAARHFVPEIEEALPHLFQFLDVVVCPVLDWIYACCMKFINILVSDPLVAKILEFLRSLAA